MSSLNNSIGFECLNCHAILSSDDISKIKKCTICQSSNLKLIYLDEANKTKLKENIKQSYDDIINFMKRWVDIPDEYMKFLSIWIMGTYIHKKLTAYPYILLNAMKGSGKTRLLKIISWLQNNGTGEVLNNPSESVLFRTASERGLILDEFESEKNKEKETLRQYLNSCYKPGGIVYRMEKQKVDGKEKQVPVGHSLYTPIAMANINGVEDVLGDRSITIIIEKSVNYALIKKIEDFDTNTQLQTIKANLKRFCVELCSVYPLQNTIGLWNQYIEEKYTPLNTIHTIHNTTQLNITDEDRLIFNKIDSLDIFGRNLELLLPLILIAKAFDNQVFDEILNIAKHLNADKRETDYLESRDITLIEFISKQEELRFNYIFVDALLSKFKDYIGWKFEEEFKWCNVTWFGSALKRLKLYSNRKREAKGTKILLNVDNAKQKLKIFKSDLEASK